VVLQDGRPLLRLTADPFLGVEQKKQDRTESSGDPLAPAGSCKPSDPREHLQRRHFVGSTQAGTALGHVFGNDIATYPQAQQDLLLAAVLATMLTT
jgi:hypothetical protein